MADKFYWLKLKRDFFKRHDIRIIESMQNGKDYILFYLKLLCESVDHEGNLRFNDQIPYNEEMLATVTNTNVDIVRSAIKIFTQLGMMEIMDDGTYFMNEVNKMIGTSIQDEHTRESTRLRVQAYRERKKQEALQNCYGNVTCNGEIELEKEKEIDINISCSKQASNDSDFEKKFDKFWEEYPRKVGKEKCLRWFKTHKVTDELLDKMIAAIKKQKKTEQWFCSKYIPHPFTWLNRGGWDDEVEDGGFNYEPVTWDEL